MAVHTAISICTGVGMLDHGVDLALGGSLRPILYVEREAFAVAHLAWQMEAGLLAQAPVWDDLTRLCEVEPAVYIRRVLAGRPLDLLIGGIPCQPWSVAGRRRGADDARDLWPSTFRAIAEYQPGIVFLENVPGEWNHFPDGTFRKIEDLESLGYRVAPGLFSSRECGANHRRERLFVLAVADSEESRRNGSGPASEGFTMAFSTNERPSCSGKKPQTRSIFNRASVEGSRLGNATKPGCENGQGQRGDVGKEQKAVIGRGGELGHATSRGAQEAMPGRDGTGFAGASAELADDPALYRNAEQWSEPDGILPHYAPGPSDCDEWERCLAIDETLEPAFCGMVDGLAARVHQLRAVGNGVDPLVAAYAFVNLWAAVEAEVMP